MPTYIEYDVPSADDLLGPESYDGYIKCPQCGVTRQSESGPTAYDTYSSSAFCKCGYSPQQTSEDGYDWNEWN